MKLKSPSTSYISHDPIVLETLKKAQELQLDINSKKRTSHSNKLTFLTHKDTVSVSTSTRKYSLSIPSKMNDATDQNVSKKSDVSQNYQQKMKEKKKFSFRKLIGKFEETSKSHISQILNKSHSDGQCDSNNNQQIESELEFAHKLMNSPEEMGLSLEGRDNEVECYIQTICEPCILSKNAINFDRLLRRIDTTNARVTTLINLCTTAILASDKVTVNFLVNSLKRMRRKQNLLISEADDIMMTFLKDPLVLLRSKKKKNDKNEGGVKFTINYPDDDDDEEEEEEEGGDKDNDEEDNVRNDDDDVYTREEKYENNRQSEEANIRWEMSSNQLSTDYSTSDSENDGPTPEFVLNLSKQIRKTEGTRLKQNLRLINRKKSSNMGDKKASFNVPPPLNPLGHNRNDLLRSHATVASGLCQQGHKMSSSSMLSSNSGLNPTDAINTMYKPTLPFNLLSLTGQLSWLISEYIERGSSTYKWATELINSIGKMSVTRSTWLNVHQQLRETTELLYSHRDQQLKAYHSTSETPQGEIAWTKLQALHQTILTGDLNACTITSNNLKALSQSTKQVNNERKLVRLSCLLEKKLHLAYLCDLLLWKAHKITLTQLNYTDEDLVKCQSMDFQIRLFELQLDQSNGQNWSTNLMDFMMCWINDICEWKAQFNLNTSDIDYFMWNEFYVFKNSVQNLLDLVKSLNACKLIRSALDDQVKKQLDVNNPTNSCNLSSSISNINLDDNQSRISSSDTSSKLQTHRSLHNQHPHQSHHSQGDFRSLDADRCSRSYAALVRQIQEHAMNNRPLAYFAERALYDIAVELGCTVNWDERFDSLSKELKNAWQEWELIIREKIDRDF
ncbi:unnamed protein product [Schistosoma turkestanicum]|nr:unnamed protein product [Schistosoma turkestanicum]